MRREYGLTLTQTGLLLSLSSLGSLVTLIPWGIATDRAGERAVLVLGLATCGGALVGAAFVHRFAALGLLLLVAGATGAGIQSASGRAVMHWFPAGERGLALGLRQTAVPVSGFLVSLGLPPIEHAGGVPWAFAAMGIACLTGAAVGGLVVREGPGREEPTTSIRVSPLRDSRLWRLSVGSALVIAPQMCVVGFAVVFLHDRRSLTTSSAAAVLAVMQLLAIGARVAAGRWSDLLRSRLVPFRRIALTAAALVGATGLLVSAPLAVLVPVLVAGGVVAMSWNSLSFAAAVELAGHERSGVAIGLQQTMLSLSAVYPTAFGALVGATSWEVAFVSVAAFPLAGWRVLRALPG